MNLSSSPKISILLPCYNVEKYVESTIKSILNQTYKNWEIIAVDDVSTDNTLKVLKKFKDSRITILEHTKNAGVGSAASTAGLFASGEYLIDMGSDDLLSPNALEKMINTFNNSTTENLGLIYSGFVSITEEGKPLSYTPHKDNKAYDFSRANLLKYNYITPLRMFKKKYYDYIGGFDKNLRIAPDYDMWLRLSEICNFERLKGEYLYYYRQRATSISAEKKLEQEEAATQIREAAISRLRKKGIIK